MRSKPCLTLADVYKIVAACKGEAEKNQLEPTISIVDFGSNQI